MSYSAETRYAFSPLFKQNCMDKSAAAFIRNAKHPLWFRFFLIRKLPSAFFAGIRLDDLDTESARVSVPYWWFSRNPFRSTYFACLSMAAEMSTGLLVMAHTRGHSPSISILVTAMGSSYFKKATGVTYFTCTQGAEIAEAVKQAVSTGQPVNIRIPSTGHNRQNEKIAEFLVTWSLKVRSARN